MCHPSHQYTRGAPDVEHHVPRLVVIEASIGTLPETFIADAGY